MSPQDVVPGEHPSNSINELTFAGEFGFKRLEGPFSVSKSGTVWAVEIPDSYDHPAARTLGNDEGKTAVLVADCRVVGGGIVDDVHDPDGEPHRTVLVDQYAMGDPNA